MFLKTMLFGASTTWSGMAFQLLIMQFVKKFFLCCQFVIISLIRLPLLFLLEALLVQETTQLRWSILFSILKSCVRLHLSLLTEIVVRLRLVSLSSQLYFLRSCYTFVALLCTFSSVSEYFCYKGSKLLRRTPGEVLHKQCSIVSKGLDLQT